MARKRRPGKFSVVKAVKLNARAQVGQPPASRVFVVKGPARIAAKHKETLARALGARDESD